jgi:predicted TIM-barrel fold metal-dependent hydrolase
MVVDISGTLADSGLVEALVRAVGAERVLFGTDNTDFHYCLGKVMGAQLSEAQRQLILCGNACQLLGLTSSP